MTRPDLIARARRLFGADPFARDEPDPVEALRQVVASLQTTGTVRPELLHDARTALMAADVAAAERRFSGATIHRLEDRRRG